MTYDMTFCSGYWLSEWTDDITVPCPLLANCKRYYTSPKYNTKYLSFMSSAYKDGKCENYLPEKNEYEVQQP